MLAVSVDEYRASRSQRADARALSRVDSVGAQQSRSIAICCPFKLQARVRRERFLRNRLRRQADGTSIYARQWTHRSRLSMTQMSRSLREAVKVPVQGPAGICRLSKQSTCPENHVHLSWLGARLTTRPDSVSRLPNGESSKNRCGLICLPMRSISQDVS